MIEIDIQYLIKHNITAHQFVILKLASENKYQRLLDYLKATDTHRSFKEDWERLYYENGLASNAPDGLANVNNFKPSVEFTRSMTFANDPFKEFYDTYPVKVLRKNGTYDYLRVDHKRCDKIYANIIVGNPEKHRFIMRCLKAEIDYRTQHNEMSFMKRMLTWLTSEAWTTFADMIEDDHNSTTGAKTAAYGTNIE